MRFIFCCLLLICAPFAAFAQFGTYFLNNSGGEIPQYSPVVIDTGEDNAITLSASAAELFVVGVAAEDIAVGVTGIVTLSGSISVVNTLGTVDRGDPLVTSETPGYARAYSDYTEADAIFGVALTAAEAVEGEGEAGADTVEVLLLSAYALQRIVDDGFIMTQENMAHLGDLLDPSVPADLGMIIASNGEGEGEAEWSAVDINYWGGLLDPTIPETADQFLVSTGEGESEWQETSLSDTTAKIFGEGTTALTLPAGSTAAPSLLFAGGTDGGFGDGQTFSWGNATPPVLSTTDPRRIFVGVNGGAAQIEILSYRNALNLCVMNARAARGTEEAPLNLGSGDNGMVWRLRAYQTGTTFTDVASLRMVAAEAHSAAALGTRIEFYTTPNGTTAEALATTITNDKQLTVEGNGYIKGNVGIGTAPSAYDLDVSGAIRASGNVSTTGGAITLPVTNALYFGDNSTDGSWRMMVSGGNFIIQYRQSGAWSTKSTVTP